MSMVVTMYIGKEQVKIDLDNLLQTDVEVLNKITYETAKKYSEFIAAVEITIEDCTSALINIVDEVTFKLAIADLINIINHDKEDDVMNEVFTVDGEVVVDATDVVIEDVVIEEKEASVMNNTITGNMKEAVEEVFGKFVEAKEHIKMNVGETREEYIEKVDDSLNVMKGALGKVLDALDNVLGYTILKDSILDIIEAGMDGKSSKKDLFRMAQKCRELIEEEIENLEYWGDQESFKKAVQLKEIVGECRGKSVFEAFAAGCIWIAKKVMRKLRKWFKVDDEKSVLGAICRSICGFARIIRAGVVFVWNTAKFAVSFVIAGAIKLIDFIYRAIKALVCGTKEWFATKLHKVTEEDFDFEDTFEEEDFFVPDSVVVDAE